MSTQALLVELVTEELPPKALKKLGDAFAVGIVGGLAKRALCAADANYRMFASPRRLAVCVDQVAALAPDQAFTEKLMPVAVGLDKDGLATPALLKKLAAKNLSHLAMGDLLHESDGKALQLLYRGTARGLSLAEGLQAALQETLGALPVPKMMTYQLADGVTDVQFVRPAHGLVAMHGSDVVDVAALGLRSNRVTHGHRFQGAAELRLEHVDEYETRLETDGGVLASFDQRRHEIERLLIAHAEQCGDTLGERDDYLALLDEVTGLVEMPTVYVGQFEQEFLEVPTECLVLTMKLNQKYFPLFHSEGGLSSRFLIVSNMRLDDPRNVIEGNQRVVRPRLSDARFFFQTDQKTSLADRVPKLANVVYHNKLGSQGDRVLRVQRLAGEIAQMIGADRAAAERAAYLAKADLVTDMVAEFPELQGTMGRYYALHDGESAVVADAIAQHYQPRFSGDVLPETAVALCVAIADKMETLAGLFSIGQEPTGDKDPFALRRHALGVLRMLIERDLPLSVRGLVTLALAAYAQPQAEAGERLTQYLFDRLVGYLRELGFSALEVDAVVSVRPPWGEMPRRLAAVRAFVALPAAQNLAAANKRIGNILKKAEGVTAHYDYAQLVDAAEKSLADAILTVAPDATAHFEAGEYQESLVVIAQLREPVDAFFDQVMVNADDPAVRANRLGLLATLHREMNRVADLSKLAS